MTRALAIRNGKLAWASRARGQARSGEMNRTEAAYAAYLEQRRHVGEVEWFAFDAVTLKLGPDVRYRPDFLVMLAGGLLELHEVKGRKAHPVTGADMPYMQDDAKAKHRIAAGMFPIPVVVAFPAKGGGWHEERV